MTVLPPTLTGHRDGYCLRDGDGAVIDVFPTFQGAQEGYRAACAALALLQDVLNRASHG